MDTELNDDLARESAPPTGQIERAAPSPPVPAPDEDTSEAHAHSEVIEIGPLRAEIKVRSETLESRIARLERRKPTGG